MTIHILSLSVVSFAAGVSFGLYLWHRSRFSLFVLILMAVGMVSGIAGTLIRMEVEKTRARIDEVRKLEAVVGK
jgi:hypothetical protein